MTFTVSLNLVDLDSRSTKLISSQCPSSDSGIDRFACPSPDIYGRFLCIDDQHICNGYMDCPKGEDEDTMSCMFYKSHKPMIPF
ncbi:hypothetical protein BLOT_009945 [Blomia tropicalis]|nr:hypothetical protein BLOT_009945 [Blomia tropicalis]